MDMNRSKTGITLEIEPDDERRWFLANVAITLFTLSAVCLCLALALWQWQRALAADQRFELMNINSVQVLDSIPINPEQYQRVKISGNVENIYFLDNRFRDHQAGREVLAEISITVRDASNKLLYDRMLVNIGWQPRNAGLTPSHAIPESLSIEGMIKIPSAGFILQDPQLDPNWPRLMQSIDLALLSQVQSNNYYPAVIHSTEAVSGWSPNTVKIENKHMMHIGYCIQWLLLAAVFVILFIKLAKSRDKYDDQQAMAV